MPTTRSKSRRSPADDGASEAGNGGASSSAAGTSGATARTPAKRKAPPAKAAGRSKRAATAGEQQQEQRQQQQQHAADEDRGSGGDGVGAQLTVEEAKLYDRQIRLWGMAAQQRMRNARILVAGCTGLANEIVKNIVLAGVGAVTVQDDRAVEARDLGAQFFLREEDIGKNRAECAVPRAQQLNPRVQMRAETRALTELGDDFVGGFDLVCVTGADPATLTRVDEAARARGIPFWGASVLGTFGFVFSDLQEFRHAVPQRAGEDGKQTAGEAVQSFSSFAAMRAAKFGHAKVDRKFRRRVHPQFFGHLVLWAFWTKHGRYPDAARGEDAAEVAAVKASTMAAAECDAGFLDDDLVCEAAVNSFVVYDAWEAVAQVVRAG